MTDADTLKAIKLLRSTAAGSEAALQAHWKQACERLASSSARGTGLKGGGAAASSSGSSAMGGTSGSSSSSSSTAAAAASQRGQQGAAAAGSAAASSDATGPSSSAAGAAKSPASKLPPSAVRPKSARPGATTATPKPAAAAQPAAGSSAEAAPSSSAASGAPAKPVDPKPQGGPSAAAAAAASVAAPTSASVAPSSEKATAGSAKPNAAEGGERPRKRTRSPPPPPLATRASDGDDDDDDDDFVERAAKRPAGPKGIVAGSPGTPGTPDLGSPLEEPVRYKIEKLLRHRKVNGGYTFLVKWWDYDSSHNTWEPEENVEDIKLIIEYKMSNGIELSEADRERLDVETEDESCCEVCKALDSVEGNPIVICDGCERGWHVKCHKPRIPDNVVKDEDAPWECANCAAGFSAATAGGGAAAKPAGAAAAAAASATGEQDIFASALARAAAEGTLPEADDAEMKRLEELKEKDARALVRKAKTSGASGSRKGLLKKLAKRQRGRGAR